ncbi:MAG: T9SS type A sorting domain-containing protein [Saprospiraceae bacterium]
MFRGQDVLLFNYADTSRSTTPYYSAITYDSLGVIPFSIVKNGISYGYPTALIHEAGETFGEASFAYFAYIPGTPERRALLFVDDQLQPLGEYFTTGIFQNSYQYSVDSNAYFTTNTGNTTASYNRKYSIVKLDFQSSSTLTPPENHINVYPNPSNGWITIEDQSDTPISSVSLVSNLGQVVKTWERPSTGEKLTFDVPKGIYNLAIRMDNNQLSSKRIVIQ